MSERRGDWEGGSKKDKNKKPFSEPGGEVFVPEGTADEPSEGLSADQLSNPIRNFDKHLEREANLGSKEDDEIEKIVGPIAVKVVELDDDVKKLASDVVNLERLPEEDVFALAAEFKQIDDRFDFLFDEEIGKLPPEQRPIFESNLIRILKIIHSIGDKFHGLKTKPASLAEKKNVIKQPIKKPVRAVSERIKSSGTETEEKYWELISEAKTFEGLADIIKKNKIQIFSDSKRIITPENLAEIIFRIKFHDLSVSDAPEEFGIRAKVRELFAKENGWNAKLSESEKNPARKQEKNAEKKPEREIELDLESLLDVPKKKAPEKVAAQKSSVATKKAEPPQIDFEAPFDLLSHGDLSRISRTLPRGADWGAVVSEKELSKRSKRSAKADLQDVIPQTRSNDEIVDSEQLNRPEDVKKKKETKEAEVKKKEEETKNNAEAEVVTQKETEQKEAEKAKQEAEKRFVESQELVNAAFEKLKKAEKKFAEAYQAYNEIKGVGGFIKRALFLDNRSKEEVVSEFKKAQEERNEAERELIELQHLSSEQMRELLACESKKVFSTISERFKVKDFAVIQGWKALGEANLFNYLEAKKKEVDEKNSSKQKVGIWDQFWYNRAKELDQSSESYKAAARGLSVRLGLTAGIAGLSFADIGVTSNAMIATKTAITTVGGTVGSRTALDGIHDAWHMKALGYDHGVFRSEDEAKVVLARKYGLDPDKIIDKLDEDNGHGHGHASHGAHGGGHGHGHKETKLFIIPKPGYEELVEGTPEHLSARMQLDRERRKKKFIIDSKNPEENLAKLSEIMNRITAYSIVNQRDLKSDVYYNNLVTMRNEEIGKLYAKRRGEPYDPKMKRPEDGYDLTLYQEIQDSDFAQIDKYLGREKLARKTKAAASYVLGPLGGYFRYFNLMYKKAMFGAMSFGKPIPPEVHPSAPVKPEPVLAPHSEVAAEKNSDLPNPVVETPHAEAVPSPEVTVEASPEASVPSTTESAPEVEAGSAGDTPNPMVPGGHSDGLHSTGGSGEVHAHHFEKMVIQGKPLEVIEKSKILGESGKEYFVRGFTVSINNESKIIRLVYDVKDGKLSGYVGATDGKFHPHPEMVPDGLPKNVDEALPGSEVVSPASVGSGSHPTPAPAEASHPAEAARPEASAPEKPKTVEEFGESAEQASGKILKLREDFLSEPRFRPSTMAAQNDRFEASLRKLGKSYNDFTANPSDSSKSSLLQSIREAARYAKKPISELFKADFLTRAGYTEGPTNISSSVDVGRMTGNGEAASAAVSENPAEISAGTPVREAVIMGDIHIPGKTHLLNPRDLAKTFLKDVNDWSNIRDSEVKGAFTEELRKLARLYSQYETAHDEKLKGEMVKQLDNIAKFRDANIKNLFRPGFLKEIGYKPEPGFIRRMANAWSDRANVGGSVTLRTGRVSADVGGQVTKGALNKLADLVEGEEEKP